MSAIREISETNKTIELIDSEITFGRGPFLEVTDKRVSRKHGILKRTADGIQLKSIHVNPCFYSRKSTPDEWIRLDKDESVILCPGDYFSLLPKLHIYMIIGEIVNNESPQQQNGIVTHNPHEETDIHIDVLNGKPNPITKIHPDLTSKEQTNGEIVASSTFMDDKKQIARPKETKRKLPSWMQKKNSTQTTRKQDTKIEKKKLPKKRVSIEFDSAEESNHNRGREEEQNNEPAEKSNVVTSEIVKVADTSVSTESPSDQNENKDGSTNSAPNDEKECEDVSSNSASQQSGSRSVCPYGSSCYRKNPTHRMEFCHPGDVDYREDPSEILNSLRFQPDTEKEECPHGTNCYRRNPLHKRQYKHTRRMAPKRRVKLNSKRNGEGSSDYDSYSDDTEEDLEVSDEDSEWEPSQKGSKNASQPRKRQKLDQSDSDEATSGDDVDDLVTDAKKFAANRKMWKR